VEKEAAGVVAAIIAYNYPTSSAGKLAPALAAAARSCSRARPNAAGTLALAELIAEHTDLPPRVVSGADLLRGGCRRVLTTQSGRRHGHLHRLKRPPAAGSCRPRRAP